ncbi:MAG: SDR family oxidoreductase [Gaiellales bacterium]|mgnify:FL=1|nr:SDR family oxidoreductase [Gaiellales bacterium]
MAERGDLTGKVAMVTGAGAGIGRAVSLRLAERGAVPAALDIREEAAAGTAAAVAAIGGKALAVQCDVTNYASVTAAVNRVVSELGAPDILVNNAGIDIVRMFVDTDEALWRKLVDVNYIGFLAVTHATAPHMIAKKSGLIINIGSDAGRIGNPGDAVYCGTKAAVMATSKALAREFARYNIRVNCVAPGPIGDTEMGDVLYGEGLGDKIARMIPLKRLGTAEDVADVVGFFASEDAAYLTGQVLSVDGGLTMIS